MYAPVQQHCTLNVFLSLFDSEKILMKRNNNALDKVQIKKFIVSLCYKLNRRRYENSKLHADWTFAVMFYGLSD